MTFQLHSEAFIRSDQTTFLRCDLDLWPPLPSYECLWKRSKT